jgi:hypothetical protein
MIYIDKPDNELQRIFDATFPGYKGRTFSVQPMSDNHFDFTGGYWDGGSKSTYRVVRLDTLQTVSPRGLSTPSNFGGPINPQATLPENTAVVEHAMFCGKDHGLTLHVPESNATKFLPAPVELSKNETIVLGYTSHLKNSYGGRKNIRFSDASVDTGITANEWGEAKAEMISRGFLKKNGAITPSGRNAVPNFKTNGDYALHRS